MLSSSTLDTIAQYGAALEDATGIQAVAVVVDFLDGRTRRITPPTSSTHGASASRAKTTAWSCLLARGDRKIQIGTGKARLTA